jgi:hypothetical protein
VGQLTDANETILYVEDEITVRSLTAHVLRRQHGPEACAASRRATTVRHGGGGRPAFSDGCARRRRPRARRLMRARSTGARILSPRYGTRASSSGTVSTDTAFLQSHRPRTSQETGSWWRADGNYEKTLPILGCIFVGILIMPLLKGPRTTKHSRKPW